MRRSALLVSVAAADPGYHFAIYHSPDLATWEHLPGVALRAGQDGDCAHDWFWAPEVHHNPETGLYFFYAGRPVPRHRRGADTCTTPATPTGTGCGTTTSASTSRSPTSTPSS